MLRQHKNALLAVVTHSGLEPGHFDVHEDAVQNTFTLTHKASSFLFRVRNSADSHYEFDIAYSKFAPGLPITRYLPEEGWKDIGFVIKNFEWWIGDMLKAYLDELATPDLWEQIKNQERLSPSGNLDEQEFRQFTEEEKKQIRLALAEFRLQIKEAFNPSADQLKVIDARLDYVSGALDRLNRFDWKSTLISTTLSISTALSLDTQQGRHLWELAKRVVSTVLMLTQ